MNKRDCLHHNHHHHHHRPGVLSKGYCSESSHISLECSIDHETLGENKKENTSGQSEIDLRRKSEGWIECPMVNSSNGSSAIAVATVEGGRSECQVKKTSDKVQKRSEQIEFDMDKSLDNRQVISFVDHQFTGDSFTHCASSTSQFVPSTTTATTETTTTSVQEGHLLGQMKAEFTSCQEKQHQHASARSKRMIKRMQEEQEEGAGGKATPPPPKSSCRVNSVESEKWSGNNSLHSDSICSEILRVQVTAETTDGPSDQRISQFGACIGNKFESPGTTTGGGNRAIAIATTGGNICLALPDTQIEEEDEEQQQPSRLHQQQQQEGTSGIGDQNRPVKNHTLITTGTRKLSQLQKIAHKIRASVAVFIISHVPFVYLKKKQFFPSATRLLVTQGWLLVPTEWCMPFSRKK